ncbi:MAG: TetR/AcrR family transcriptional regulator [Propionibacteriaceae bacterium]|nr:TetR/AcrR family transcriptional regulator [Propionibacteriaceae bacterium]
MTRTYDNTGREASARETRRRILAAAYDLLTHRSFDSFSIQALAEHAGVSPQTIYNSIGGKSTVLKACYDVTLAGDDEPVPMRERPAFLALFEASDAAAFLKAYAHWCRVVSERVGPIVGALIAAGEERGIADFFKTIEKERRLGTAGAITALQQTHGLPEGVPLERAVDMAWTLNAPEIWDRLVRRCGWTGEDYERWIEQQLCASLT